MAVFDKKTWNDKVFQKYLKKVPNLKENSLIKNGVFEVNNSLKSRLVDGVGGNLLIEPIKGLLDGDFVNYDGKTNITTSSRGTFIQKKIACGRAKGWEEKDFSTELTGVNWMEGVAGEVAEYFQGVDMGDVLAILKGIFAMTSKNGKAFVEKHTYEIATKMGATTINSALQKGFGDKKKFINMAFMHSSVATDLENMQLLDFLKYTDSNGITSRIDIAQVGNKTVIIDDEMPAEDGYDKVEKGTEGALEVRNSGASTGQINIATVKEGKFYPTGVAEGQYVVPAVRYTTYLLGKGAIEYCDLGVKVPSEVDRDPSTDGGIDKLYTRQRKLYAPKYISWEGEATIISPMPSDFATGKNWDIVHDEAKAVYVNDKLVPFARIMSR